MTNKYSQLKPFFNTKARLGFIPAYLSLIVHLAFTLSHGAWAGRESIALPPLKIDEQKLAFLIEIKKQVPKLFSDAARYDIDLFALLDDEAVLVEQLNKYPEYAEAFATKKYYDIMIMPPKGGLLVQSSVIKPEALEAWRDKALAVLDEFGENLFDDISAQANILTNLGIKENDNIGAIITNFNKTLIDHAKQSKKTGKDLNIQLYNQITAGKDLTLKDRLQGIINRYEEFEVLPKNISGKADFQRALKAHEADEKLASLSELYVLLHRIERPAPLTNKEAQESLRALSADDLIFFSDKDALEPAIKGQLGKVVPESLIKRVVNKIYKNIKYYADQRSGEATMVTSKVHLRQVVPAVGIFRGCTGGDCSSQYSFPYPNDPNESVFFILDESNNTKGYVSATRVLAEGAPSLYVITVSGNHVSAGDTELIFRGLDTIKEQLGIIHIVLPVLANIASLINFPGPRAVYDKYASSRSQVEMKYFLPTIRETIEKYPSDYNKSKYDFMERNKMGVLFQPKDQLSKGLEVRLTELALPAIKPQELEHVPNEDIFAFMIDLHRSNRRKELSRVQNMDAVKRKIPPEAFQSFLKQSASCIASAEQPPLKVDEFERLLQSQLQDLKIPAAFLKSNPQLLWPALIFCSDAFSDDKIESTAGAIIENYFKDETQKFSLDKLLSWEDHSKVLDTIKFKSLFAGLLTNLIGQDIRAHETAIEKLRKIRPRNPAIYLTLVKVLKDSKDSAADDGQKAARVLREMFPRNPMIHLALAEALKDPKPHVRDAAAGVLMKIRPTDPMIHLALAEALKDLKPHVRESAANILGEIRPTDPAVHLALAEALKDPHESVRRRAAIALREIEPTDPAVRLAIGEVLKDVDLDPYVRTIIKRLLRQIKQADHP